MRSESMLWAERPCAVLPVCKEVPFPSPKRCLRETLAMRSEFIVVGREALCCSRRVKKIFYSLLTGA